MGGVLLSIVELAEHLKVNVSNLENALKRRGFLVEDVTTEHFYAAGMLTDGKREDYIYMSHVERDHVLLQFLIESAIREIT
jgi:hypothetical protein